MGDEQQIFGLRWIVIPAVVFVLIIAVRYGERYFTSRIETGWKTVGEEVNKNAHSDVENAIKRYIEEFRDRNNGIPRLDGFIGAMRGGQEARIRLQQTLNRKPAVHGYSAALVSLDGRLLAYTGKAPILDMVDSARIPGKHWRVADFPSRTYIMYVDTLRLEDTACILVAAQTLYSKNPLSNRFIKTRGLLQRISALTGTQAEFGASGGSQLANDGRYFHVPMLADGDTLGSVHVQRIIPAVHSVRTSEAFAKVSDFLFVLLALLISIPLHKLYRTLPLAGFIVANILHIWSIRAVFLYYSVPSALLPAELYDPILFGSSFGFGLASSLGELTLSMIALFLTLSMCALRVVKWGPLTLSRPLAFTVSSALLLIVPFMLRGYIASMRSFVSDSSINFDDVASLFTQPLLIAMYADTFLLSASTLIGLLIVIYISSAFLSLIAETSRVQIIYVIAVVAVSLALFNATTREYLIPFPVYAAAALLVLALIILIRTHNLRASLATHRAIGMYLVILTVAASALLSRFMNERRRAEVEARATIVARPIDAWASVQIDQTLIQFTLLPGNTLAGSANGIQTAFALWAESPLSGIENNSAVSIYSRRNGILAQFSAGIHSQMLAADRIAAIIDGPATTSAVVPGNQNEGRYPIYAGYVPFRLEGTDSLFIVAMLEAEDPFNPDAQRFDLLRYQARNTSFATEDALLYTRFTDGKMEAASEAGIAKVISVPESVQRAIRSGAISVWGNLELPEGKRQTFFHAPEGHADSIIYAVSVGAAEPVYSIYRILRIGVVYSISGAGVILLLMLFTRRTIRWKTLSFQMRLQIALVFTAAIPMVIVWITVRQIVKENTREEYESSLRNDLAILKSRLPVRLDSLLWHDSQRTHAADELSLWIKRETGKDINIFIDGKIQSTSRPELYGTGVFPKTLPAEAFLPIALEQRDFTMTSESISDYTYYVGYAALRASNGALLGIISTPLLYSPETTERTYIYATASMYVWFGFIFLCVLIASALLSKQISRPLRMLIGATQRIASGDLTKHVQPKGSKEIEELGEAFNTMTAHLRASRAELAAAERELAWKEMAKQVAHEIRNPLTPMRLAAQHLRYAYKAGAENIGDLIYKVTDTIEEQVERLIRISGEFSRFARMPKRNIGKVDLNEVLKETVNLFRHTGGISIECKFDDAIPPVTADREELSSVFTNILRNAVQSIAGTGVISIYVWSRNEYIDVTIIDTGSGISEEHLPRIFEPSFSTKTDGMGLGLAIVKKILDDMGARISIESTPGEGTSVRISFYADR